MRTIILAFAIAVNWPAVAFTLNSPSSSSFKGWSNAHIHFRLNLANCPASVDVRGIIKDALDVWNNVANSRLKLSVDGDTSSATFGDPITIVCDTNYGSGDPGIANGSPGAAQVMPASGDAITSGLMSLNASSGNANIANFSRELVAVTLAHEIGHLIGLGHSQSISALMYYDASAKTKLALSQDDIDAVTYLYPRDELNGDGLLGCGRIESSIPPSASHIWIALIALFFPLIVLIKLRANGYLATEY